MSLSREVVSVIAVRTGVRAGQRPQTDTSCGTQCSDTKAGGSCGVCNFP
ncbi:MAG TPA: hypothetical protein VFS00_11040 [Polyangiaceae bacterium]|nr:hypothetical protein [Polyangiaceae bacterium]